MNINDLLFYVLGVEYPTVCVFQILIMMYIVLDCEVPDQFGKAL